ncbi:MAG: hypothetical protein ACRC7O_14770 [Fimbriiglobus sp.]
MPPETWGERLRHARLLYLVLAVLIPAWIGIMVWLVVALGRPGWFVAMVVATIPIAVYSRILQLRYLLGRDPHTGERFPPNPR